MNLEYTTSVHTVNRHAGWLNRGGEVRYNAMCGNILSQFSVNDSVQLGGSEPNEKIRFAATRRYLG